MMDPTPTLNQTTEMIEMTNEPTREAAEAATRYGKPTVERFGSFREMTQQYLLQAGNDGWFICGDGTATPAGGERTS